MREEWIHRIALTWGNRTRLRSVRQALDRYDSAREAADCHPELISKEALSHAQKEMEFVEKHAIGLYYYKDLNYPYRLQQCVDAPLVLYTKGEMNVNPKHVVSVVGTRMPSERGKDWCRWLVLDLAERVPDLTIVSGLAYGIDVVAHRAAIEAGVPTIIVPAHGLDRIYPAVHRQVAVEAVKNGDTEFIPPHFDKTYLETEQKKKELETRISACLKSKDFKTAKKLCEQLEEIIGKMR